MRTTPYSFYELFVEPNLADYLCDPGDVRLAFNAVLPAFQLADVFYAFYEEHDRRVINQWPKPKQLHIHLCAIEPDYVTIQSVATVYKHLYAKGGHYQVGSPSAVWGVSVPGQDVELHSKWVTDQSDVFVKRIDGTEVSLSTALKKVVYEMWPSFLPDEREIWTRD